MAYEDVKAGSWMESRICWGAVFAGALVAFVSILILNSLGVAIGLTAGDRELGLGTAIWAVFVALVSLFAGGCVMSFLEKHETKTEALIHGVVLWGVLFFGITMLAVSGIEIGLNMFIGATTSMNLPMSFGEISRMARELGLTNDQMAILRDRFATNQLPSAQAAWWSFAGMVVSLGAVLLGALGGEKAKDTSLRVTRLNHRSAA